MTAWTVHTNSARETGAWGERLGRLAEPGDFFALTGEIGAGKTVFAQGVLRGLGVDADLGSPTFTLVHEYRGRLPVYHLDVYRLGPDAQHEDLGYDEMFYGPGVTLVEWADLIRPLWPADHLAVHLTRAAGAPPERRQLTFTAGGTRGAELVAALAGTAEEPIC